MLCVTVRIGEIEVTTILANFGQSHRTEYQLRLSNGIDSATFAETESPRGGTSTVRAWSHRGHHQPQGQAVRRMAAPRLFFDVAIDRRKKACVMAVVRKRSGDNTEDGGKAKTNQPQSKYRE